MNNCKDLKGNLVLHAGAQLDLFYLSPDLNDYEFVEMNTGTDTKYNTNLVQLRFRHKQDSERYYDILIISRD